MVDEQWGNTQWTNSGSSLVRVCTHVIRLVQPVALHTCGLVVAAYMNHAPELAGSAGRSHDASCVAGAAGGSNIHQYNYRQVGWFSRSITCCGRCSRCARKTKHIKHARRVGWFSRSTTCYIWLVQPMGSTTTEINSARQAGWFSRSIKGCGWCSRRVQTQHT